MWALLIAGKNWESISWAASAFLLLAFCVFGLSFALLIREIQKHTRKSTATKPTATQPPAVTLPSQTAKMITHASKPALLILLGLAIGGPAGYVLGHDAREKRSYTDVLIVARHDSTHYTLQPQWMKPWEMTTCSPMDWETGQKMQFLNFKYHPACDDVESGSFVFYSEADGRRRIFSQEVLNAGN